MANSMDFSTFQKRVAEWAQVFGCSQEELLGLVLEPFLNQPHAGISGYTTFSRKLMGSPDFKTLSTCLPRGLELARELLQKDSQARRVLQKLAEAIDQLGRHNQHVFWLTPDVIFWNGQEIMFSPLDFGRMVVSDEMQLDERVRKQYGYRLPFRELFIRADVIHADLERYAFVYLLLELLFPDVPFQKMDKNMIRKFLRFFSNLFASVFQKLLGRWLKPLSRQPQIAESPQQILAETIEAIEQDIFYYRAAYEELRHSYYYNIQRGEHKKGTHAEDEYECIRSKAYPNRCFVLIADGVSTASLGDGETMARELRSAVKKESESIEKFLDAVPLQDFEAFQEHVRKYLHGWIARLNENAVARLNDELQKAGKTPQDVSDPMSSTLVLGVACGNWVCFTHVGDSEVILVRRQESYIVNRPSNRQYYRILEESRNAPVIREHADGDSELAYAIPMMEPEENRYRAAFDEGKLEDVAFCLKARDIVVFATDGLLSCLGNSTEQREPGLERFNQLLRDKQDAMFEDKIRSVLREAAKNSIDDVALVALECRPAETLQKGSSPSGSRALEPQDDARKQRHEKGEKGGKQRMI